MINPCHHDARLYLVNVSPIRALVIAPKHLRQHDRAFNRSPSSRSLAPRQRQIRTVASDLGRRSVDACDTVQVPAPRSEAQMTIYFYGADEVPYGCFSNFSGHGFDLDGHWWTTSEHYFQAQKFPGTRHAELIRRTATPLRATELGRDRRRIYRTHGRQSYLSGCGDATECSSFAWAPR
ncbi:NADAR family protein [Micromonospora zamorensis]|uniref:NADAR family protein n=1 Tax=Micromonospora zamorensis TaxID=709883 RepID=UPI003D940EF8